MTGIPALDLAIAAPDHKKTPRHRAGTLSGVFITV